MDALLFTEHLSGMFISLLFPYSRSLGPTHNNFRATNTNRDVDHMLPSLIWRDIPFPFLPGFFLINDSIFQGLQEVIRTTVGEKCEIIDNFNLSLIGENFLGFFLERFVASSVGIPFFLLLLSIIFSLTPLFILYLSWLLHILCFLHFPLSSILFSFIQLFPL